MNTEMEYPEFRAYKTPKKRRYIFYLYLIMFGVIIGVVLTNYLRPSKGEPENPVAENADMVKTAAKAPMQSPTIRSKQASKASPQMAPQPHPGGVSDFEDAVITATQKAMAAVVSIHVSGTQVVYYRFRDPFMNMLYGRQLARKPINGMGSGVIIDPNGIIITNDHVINISNQENANFKKDAIEIKVELTDGRTFPAKVMKNFPVQDIALLSIDEENLPHLELGSSSKISPGQTVLAIGNPFGDRLSGGLLGSEPTVTRGIISATRRNLTIPGEGITRYYRNMLQTDASINEGNSGGALVDLDGKLVGINTAIMSPGGTGSIGIGFAFPVDRVRMILDRVKEDGDIGQWYTGISVQELTASISRSLGYDGAGGVLVTATERNSPGEKSGLKRGDIITKIDGYTTMNTDEILSIFNGALPGERFNLSVFRDGGQKNIMFEMGTR